MKDLLENNFVSHYQLAHSRPRPTADCVETDSEEFDLDDLDDTTTPIKPVGKGKLTLSNPCFGCMEIASYERFVNQCKKPPSFLQGRKKCDFFVLHQSDDGYAMLIELTSATGSIKNLSRPIPPKGEHQYPGGKYEKAVDQLSHSLKDLLFVPAIKQRIESKQHKVCLMAYRFYPHPDPSYLKKHPMERYLKTEAAETADNGAILSCPEIENRGFEYRRISHDHPFRME